MFRLHDRTRRLLCVAAFVLLGIAPTVAVAVWSVVRHWPGRVAAEAESLGRRLGLNVRLAGLTHVRPGVVRYQGLQLSDPETGRRLLSCPAVECQWTRKTGPAGRDSLALALTAVQPEIQADALPELGCLAQRFMQAQTGWAEPDARLDAGDVTLRLREGAIALRQVQGLVATLPGGVQAEVSFRMTGQGAGEPLRIRLGRNRQMTPPATGVEFSTGGAAVAMSTLALVLPDVSVLGPDARFQGSIWAHRLPDGWQGELSGQLLDVELGLLLRDGFPHKLSGPARLDVNVARFRQGRVEEAAAVLPGGPGLVSRSLLDAAVERLGLARGNPPATANDLVPYEQLAVAIVINRQGLALRGQCPGAERTILADRYGALLGDPLSPSLPSAALVHLLLPASDLVVPASRQSERLIRLLPVPEALAPSTALRP